MSTHTLTNRTHTSTPSSPLHHADLVTFYNHVDSLHRTHGRLLRNRPNHVSQALPGIRHTSYPCSPANLSHVCVCFFPSTDQTTLIRQVWPYPSPHRHGVDHAEPLNALFLVSAAHIEDKHALSAHAWHQRVVICPQAYIASRSYDTKSFSYALGGWHSCPLHKQPQSLMFVHA